MAIHKPLTRVEFLGDVAYGDITVAAGKEAKKRLNFRNPLLLMAGKGGSYEGEDSAQAGELTIGVVGVKTPTVRFKEFDVQQTKTGTAQATSAIGSTTLDVGTAVAALLRPQDGIHFPDSGMNVRVVDITSPIDGTITIERAVGSQVTSPATVHPVGFTRFTDVAITSGDEFQIIGSMVVQNSTSRTVRGYNAPTIREAATQIFRSDIKISRTRMTQQSTDTMKQIGFEGRKEQELLYITEEIERTVLFGNMIATNGGRINATGSQISSAVDEEGNEYTTSDGIFSVMTKYAAANIVPANDASLGGGTSAFSRAKANKIAEILNRVGGGHTILCSRYLLEKINDELTDPTKTQLNINYDGTAKKVGQGVHTFETLFGTLTFKHHPIFDEATKYQKTMLCLKEENLQLMAMQGGEMSWKDGSQENDRDGKAGYYLSELGLVFAYPLESFIFNEWTI